MKRIVLLIAPILFLVLAFRPIQSHTVSGTVTDQNGAPIQNVSVHVKGSPAAVFSKQDGTFLIVMPRSSGTLVFTATNYLKKEVRINGEAMISVVLSPVPASAPKLENVLSGKVSGIMVRGLGSQPVSTGYRTDNPGYGLIKDEDGFDREGYDRIIENRFLKVSDNPLSTFSIDVDAASYSNIRRFLNNGQLPPDGAVRIEEMVNYFKYEYPQPENGNPFSVTTEMAEAPWNKDHKLVLIGLQGKKISTDNLPPSNLTFLIDVSGSMWSADKLPLVKASMKLLVDQLRQQDRISLVVYAGAAGLVLAPTSGSDKTKIKDAIDQLEAGGSTAGGEGIRLAYKTARENFVKNGNNRVILCTDGDFNVGESSDDAMERLIEEERKSGIFLTVLGFGTGNYQDAKMQKLADKGNGNHAYIDGISEARKVLVNEFGGTLFTIAKDVKLQVEFNPAKVQGYRLIGYENRMLAKEDFNDDKKDAGEMGSGHTVTALYEIIPVGVQSDFLHNVDSLKYQSHLVPLSKSNYTDEIMTVKFRYKAPDGDQSKLIEHPVKENFSAKTSDNYRFAAAVAEFGMLLRHSEYRSGSSFDNVLGLARAAKGIDEEGYRSEFIRLVENARSLAKNKPAADPERSGSK